MDRASKHRWHIGIYWFTEPRQVNHSVCSEKQFFDGTINSTGKRSLAFEDGRIRGDAIQFDFESNGKNIRLEVRSAELT